MNVHDSEQMAVLLEAHGYEEAANAKEADLILVNTCSIREKAAQKVFSQLGRYRCLKEENSQLIIGIGGCLAQQWGVTLLNRAPHVDLIFGTHQIHELPALLERCRTTGAKIVETAFQDSVKSIGTLALPKNGAVSAFVTIMQGCNNYCSYCVVPYLRGKEESRKTEDIIDEIKILADAGVKEVTLLGQNVNSYGHDLSPGTDFPSLLRKIGRINGIERIRFTTSHPKDLSDSLIACFGEVDSLCEHIHLPVQSGSDAILKKMNRGYSVKDYLRKIEGLRHQCPEISITADVIVGFPGETDEDFLATLDLMKNVKFDNLFSFKYSERPNTAAIKYEGKVKETIKLERLVELQSLQESHTEERNRQMKGRITEVLVEGFSKNCRSDLTGRTRTNKITNFAGEGRLIGKPVSVFITETFLHSLRAELAVEGKVQIC